MARPTIDENRIRKEFRRVWEITKGCRVEIIMKDNYMIRITFLLPLIVLSMVTAAAAAESSVKPQAVVLCATDASAQEILAAREIRRYVYLRTGVLLPVEQKAALPEGIDAVVVATKDRAIVGALATDADIKKAIAALGPQQYLLRTISQNNRRVLLVVGGDSVGTLYGSYRFAEHLGVRFYLHGDVVPDRKWGLAPFSPVSGKAAATREGEKGACPLFRVPELNDLGKPLFAMRGVNPWGSHPFGFDAWGTDDYKAVFTQLAKMRMNFLGVHCYPEGLPYAEPTVWHGLASDFDGQGRVKFSYVSRYYNTLFTPAWGDYSPKKTGDYSFGGGLLFERDDWAPPVMVGHTPLPTTPEGCNEVFNRMAGQFRDAFGFARQLGVKTCLGTEAPLTIPKAVRDRLKAQGKNPADPAVVRDVYEATFRRIMASHPLDYYWLWTPEGWTWEGNKPEQYKATVADIKLATEALKNVNAPFKLATAGWVLGPAHDRAAFDNDLPKDVPMSAISQKLGHSPVDPAFGRISGREKWAIPWLESDGVQGLAGIQLFAGRMRRDAADAAQYGCTGLMGLQWRTDILAPNASALAQAAWDQSWSVNRGATKSRYLPCDDFYTDWALANFGPEAADGIAKVFIAIDGKVPLATADGCPVGPLNPDATPWATVAARFAFVDALEKLRPSVRGAGNLDRFDYWLNTFKYYRSLVQVRCALGAKASPAEITRLWGDAYRYLLGSVNTPGGLAMVVNMKNHPGWGPLVAPHASQPWPKEYQGPPRIVVPTLRSSLALDETLTLKAIMLSAAAPHEAAVYWREMGRGEFQKIPLRHVARGVYEVRFPPEGAKTDVEYYLEAQWPDGPPARFPATAPAVNQTLVLLPTD